MHASITIVGKTGAISEYTMPQLRKMAVAATKLQGKLIGFVVSFNEGEQSARLLCSYHEHGNQNAQSFTSIAI